MYQANVNLGVFQDMKVTWGVGVYTRDSSRYLVAAAKALRPHRGGVVVFYCKTWHLTLEVLCLQGLNVASFQLVTGRQRWHVVGCYIAPGDPLNIDDVIEGISRRP